MNKSRKACVGLGILLIAWIGISITTTKTIITNPIEGITCLTADGLISKTDAGCYRGNIFKDSCLDAEATEKYQPGAFVISWHQNCKK